MPMPPDPPLDALGLAGAGTVVERHYPIAGFDRLGDYLAQADGTAEVRLALSMSDGTPVGTLSLRAEVMLVCQRCLRPVRQELASQAQLAFAPREDALLPADHEVIPGDPRRVDLALLVEDELLLSLPLIARHAAGEDCSALPGEAPAPPEMRRPFAGLKDLLKH
jgi:uncharacterized protein